MINIAFHAVNALLVLRIGETAAGLSLGPAAFAALVFAILPMQTESVAWVTGRVDSMPACFYLASFLLFVRWRAASPGVALYLVGGGLFCRAVYEAEHRDAASRALAVRRDRGETPGASVMELASALRAVRAAHGRLPGAALCALR